MDNLKGALVTAQIRRGLEGGASAELWCETYCSTPPGGPRGIASTLERVGSGFGVRSSRLMCIFLLICGQSEKNTLQVGRKC